MSTSSTRSSATSEPGSGTYHITVHRVFSAAHALRLPNGTMEKTHGHNWTVQLTVSAPRLDAMEVVMDFHELERMLDGLLATVDSGNLNGAPPFTDGRGGLKLNPSAERVAWWLGTAVARELPDGVRLERVEVGEAPGCTATYVCRS